MSEPTMPQSEEPIQPTKSRRSIPWRSIGLSFSIFASLVLVCILLFTGLHLVKANLTVQNQLAEVNHSLDTLQTSHEHDQARIASLEQQQSQNENSFRQLKQDVTTPVVKPAEVSAPAWQSDFAIKMILSLLVILFVFILPVFWYTAKFLASIDFFIYRWKHRAHQTPEERYALLQKQACQKLIDAAATDNVARLDTAWSILARKLRRDPVVLSCYVTHLLRFPEQTEKIYKLISRSLAKHLDDVLLQQFAQLKVTNPEKQLTLAEKWLRQSPENPKLLLALGQICLRCRLWGKARTYFNHCLAHQLMPGAYLGLGQLAEETGDFESAMERYREGLENLVNGEIENVRQNVPIY